MKVGKLFEEGRIGSMSVKNRIVMPPMVLNYGDESGRSTDKYLAHIRRIARGGVGTMILEAHFVSEEGRGFHHQLGLHADHVIPGLRRLTQAGHEHGAAVGVQIYHAGRQTTSAVTGKQPVAPSPIPCPVMQELPLELDTGSIRRLVQAFGDAAGRAMSAGVDFVEIHAAHGYLVGQFLSPFTNRRDDRYGGTFENRMRFLMEIISSVRNATDGALPILVRFSADEMVPGGLTTQDGLQIARKLEDAGVDALDVSVGNYASYNQGFMIPPMAREAGALLEYVRKVKAEVSIPVIAVGKLREPDVAASVLERGDADFVAIGRGLLADPDWPNKVHEGRLSEINLCVSCNQGCIDRLFHHESALCTVNPETGRELLFGEAKASNPLNVTIVGGGPGGMWAARRAAMEGHQVELYEQSDALGGQLTIAGRSPHREEWWLFRDWLSREMSRLGVRVHLGERVTKEMLGRLHPDFVVIASGSSPVRVTFPFAGETTITTGTDVLDGSTRAKGSVVVVGGGCSGAQVAETLVDSGRPVTLVEAEDAIALDMPSDDRSLMLGRLQEKGVEVKTRTRLLDVTEGKATVRSERGDTILDAGTVVLCLGARQNNELVEACVAQGVAHVVVGDAFLPRRITEAAAEGALGIVRLRNPQVPMDSGVGRAEHYPRVP